MRSVSCAHRWFTLALFVSCLFVACLAHASGDLASPSTLYIKVRLDDPVKASALKVGDLVQGKLALAVFSGDREVFPIESPISLTVSGVGRQRRIPNDHWPWVIKIFTPRHENYPLFKAAIVSLADGRKVPLDVSLIAISQKVDVRAPARKSAASDTTSVATLDGDTHPESKNKKHATQTIVTLEGSTPDSFASSEPASTVGSSPSQMTLAAGTPARIILLTGVSAGGDVAGDSFQARLVEPVRLGPNVVLPEGSVFEGKVIKSVHPRWLSRAGSLSLTFTTLILPGGVPTPIVASVTGAELDQRSHTKIDPEGTLRGDRPGKAWMLVNAGTTVGLAKLTDDGLQLVIEAISSAATDASTAGTGRIAAICVSAIFLITRHGRDVILPRFTEMNISLDRPLLITAPNPAHP